MTSISKVSDSLSDTLCDGDLRSVCVEWADALSDTLFEDGFAKDIPIIGTIYGLGKLGVTVKDRLFLKKLLCLLSEIADVPAAERTRIILEVDRSEKRRIKIGEKLLYILDRSEDHETAQIVAFLFRAFLSGELTYDDFLRASRATQNIMVADLWRFVDDETERWDLFDAGTILNSGLVEFDESEITVVDGDEWEIHRGRGEKYQVENGQTTVSITKLGKKVRGILRPRRVTTKPNPI